MDAFSAVKTSLDTAKTAVKGLIKIEASKEVAEALEKLQDANEKLFDMRDTLFNLQQENQNLKTELQEKEDWEKKKADYELVETEAGAILYAYTGEPKHFACPVCIESKKEIHPLQPKNNKESSLMECKACDKQFRRLPYTPQPPKRIIQSKGWT